MRKRSGAASIARKVLMSTASAATTGVIAFRGGAVQLVYSTISRRTVMYVPRWQVGALTMSVETKTEAAICRAAICSCL